MATKRFILCFGQSNSGPVAEYASWIGRHNALNIANVSRVSVGAYQDLFTIPGGFPSPFGTTNIKGRAVRGIRYLTFYNPIVTGYKTYPHTGRVVSDVGGGSANTATAFYVTTVFDTVAAVGATITIPSTGESRTIASVSLVSLPSGAGSRITLSGALTLPTSNAVPVADTQFTYTIKMAAASSGTSAQLSVGFGQALTGKLTGIRMTSGAQTRTIVSWNNATKTATVDSAFSPALSSGDAVTLAPPNGITFEKWGYWLPFTPLEADRTTGREHPYPPGFNYANTFHVPYDFQPAAAAGVAITLGTISYHVGLAARLHEYFGDELYVHAAEVGGTPIQYLESSTAPSGIGWHDPSQQSHWSPGRANNCYTRWLDEMDAGIVAAAADGDTLECVGVLFVQGETDGGAEDSAKRYYANLRKFKAAVRKAIKDRGLWPASADRIPWIQPKIVEYTKTWSYASLVNAAIAQCAEEDRFMRTFSMEDAPLQDLLHYNYLGAEVLEDRCYRGLLDVYRCTADVGAVEICNLALTHIGETAKVTSIDPPDGSANAALCATYFPMARDAVLEMQSWGFATRRRAMTAVDSEASTWQYAYLFPGDVLSSVAVLAPDATDDFSQSVTISSTMLANPVMAVSQPTSQPYTVEQDSQGRKIIYTNQADAVLRYVARVTDSALYPQAFVDAVSWKLASMLAGSIVKGDAGAALARQCLAMAGMAAGRAGSQDAGQSRISPEHRPDWMPF